MRTWLLLAMIGGTAPAMAQAPAPAPAPAMAAAPDPAFKRLPAFCLKDVQGVEGDTYSEQIGKLDDALDDTDPGPACSLSDALTPRLNAVRDRLAACQARAGAISIAGRFVTDIGKVDAMISHVRAARGAVRCGG